VDRFFLRVLAARHWILAGAVIATAVGVLGALRVPNDPAIDSMIDARNPDALATRNFERIFPEGEHALLMLECSDPLSVASLNAAQRLQQRLAAIPRVQTQSLLTIYRRGASASEITDAEAGQVRRFATGTTLLSRAGLLGEHYFGIALELRTAPAAERDQALSAIDAIVLASARSDGAFSAIRRVGSPWVDAWLERETAASTARFMPLFGLFLMALIFTLYRSWRTLLAMIGTLAAVVAVSVGLAVPFGWAHTLVSTLVPLTVLVTTTATLVYLHSRYLERDPAVPLREHHARALANKLVPCTASMFATAVGFAALAVSHIRPVREMGLWTAAGLIVSWIGCFTLFPALQSLLRTPTRSERAPAAPWYAQFVERWIPLTARLRWWLLAAAILVMIAGAAALFGVPGRLAPLALQTEAIGYVNPHSSIAIDTREFERHSGLGVMELWLHTPAGGALDPQFLHALESLSRILERDPRVSAVDGPTTILRWAQYLQSGSDQLPDSPAAWSLLASNLEQILLTTPGARSSVDIGGLSDVHLTVRGHESAFGGAGAMHAFIDQQWNAARSREPALKDVTGAVVGRSVLAEQISLQLVPTLEQSFALTASVIFVAFLLVFRSPSARLMAMIPSVFAILAAFLVMRTTGMTLNVATILIGSTVLGSTENDQVHFFYHYQEGSRGAAAVSTAAALRHAFLVAGRPILFATLINTAGFLALAFSDLPPTRQFGIVSASAFLLALTADFTALPAALWILTPRARREYR